MSTKVPISYSFDWAVKDAFHHCNSVVPLVESPLFRGPNATWQLKLYGIEQNSNGNPNWTRLVQVELVDKISTEDRFVAQLSVLKSHCKPHLSEEFWFNRVGIVEEFNFDAKQFESLVDLNDNVTIRLNVHSIQLCPQPTVN